MLKTHLDKMEPNPDKELTKRFSKAIKNFGKFDFFSKRDLGQEKRIIGSILPENLTLTG